MLGKIKGGAIALVGFLLSPLSWWNDLFINIPLAYGFAWTISFLNKDIFMPAMVLGYWLTNLLGFILMHKGVHVMKDVGGEEKREIVKDVAISLAYTVLIVLFIRFGWIKFPTEYLR